MAVPVSFSKFDTNRDGFVTAEEIINTLTNKGIPFNPDRIRAVFAELDVNNDGKLTFKEFAELKNPAFAAEFKPILEALTKQ